MNRRLNPARIEYRLDSGRFQFALSKRGKRIRKTLGTDIELSYEVALLLREKHLSNDPLVSTRSITLEAWYEHLKPERKKRLAKSTWNIEKYFWGEFSDDIRNTPLNKLTQEDIESELDEIDAPSQRDHTAVFIRTILNAAVKKGLLAKSPFKYSRNKRVKKNVPTLTQNELMLLIHALPLNNRPAALLAAFCGLRRGEIMALQYKDINLSPDVMQVDVHKAKSISDGPNGIEEHIGPPKAGSIRIVPIMPDVPEDALNMMKELFERKDPTEFIYPAFQRNIHQAIKRTCKREELPVIGLHDLRHICGTHWVINHGMAFASAALGHSSIQMTIDVYADLKAVVHARTRVQPLHHPLIPKATDLAQKLVDHDDPSVRELALLTLQVCA